MRLIPAFLFFLVFACANAQSAWPSSDWSSAANLTSVMDATGVTDLSGLHWNPVTGRLYCVQGDGRLRVLQFNAATNTFSQIASKTVPGGPEGITQVNLAANEFYTIDENNYEIRKFTHTSSFGSMTESRHWSLLASPSPMQDTGNTGPEGIVFVPDTFLALSGFVSQQTGLPYASVKGMGGLMFVAHQDEGYVWAFDVNPNVNDDLVYVGKYKTNRSESCDLSFDRTIGRLYILHNLPEGNKLEVTDLSSIATTGGGRKFVVKDEYFLPSTNDENSNVEGFAITQKCPEGSAVNVWLARDAESNEDVLIKQDVLRWFSPFIASGSCQPLGIAENQLAKPLLIVDEPGNTSVTIQVDREVRNGTITLFNSVGQLITERVVSGDRFAFETGNLETGIYFFEIRACDFTAKAKWLKN